MDSKEVFISYSSKQAEIAFAVCDYLEKHDIRCWVAPRDIPSGSNYTLEIPVGIQQCKVMVLVFSETATQSQWITLEVMSAVNNNMTIIPFRIEDYPVNSNMGLYFMLQKSQWIDAFPKFEDQLENLRKDIEKIIGKKSLNLNPTDPIDQFQLGMNYFSGVYVQKDIILARKWFTVAAKQGHVKSMKMLGDLYSGNDSFNGFMANKYYKLAAEKGDSQSQYILGETFFKEGNLPEAIKWFEKSVETGSYEALEALAELYYYGNGIETDYIKSYSFCEKAILTESAKAYYLMGRMNLYGEGRKINYPIALEYINKAKSKDLKAANFELGIIYEKGLGVDKDLEKAVMQYREAHTGTSYRKIAEIRDNNKKEFKLYGIPESIETTQYYYTAGLLFEKEKDFASASEMYKIAAERGSVDAMARYGAILCDQEDYKVGLVWLQKAVNQNNAMAYTYLGNCYLEGKYYKAGKLKAYEHYKKADELGDMMGKFNLAIFHLNENLKECSPSKGVEILEGLHNFCSQRQDSHHNHINAKFYGQYYYTISEISLIRGKENHPFEVVMKSKEHSGENKVNLFEDISLILGHCNHYGIGVEKNYIKALYYLDKIRHGYNNYAEIDLGDIYSEGGFGIHRDLLSAVTNFEFSSYSSPYAQGYLDEAKAQGQVIDENYPPRANFEVGWRFISQVGVRKDISHAFEQLEIAAKANYNPAIALLYNLYITNCFVEPNNELVNLYLNLAKENDIHYIDEFIIPKEEESSIQREIDYYINLLKIFNETFGDIDYHCLIILERLGGLYIDSKHYSSALDIAGKALDIQIKLHGEQDSETAVWYSNLAYVFGLMREYEKELSNIKKGIEILHSLDDEDSEHLVDLYRRLARCYSNLEEFDKEEQAAKNAFEISLNSFGEKNPHTVHSIETMAESAINLENYEKALDLYLKALSIYQSETGEESKPTANAYHNISDVYWSLGNLEEAIKYEQKALQIYRKLYGKDSQVCEPLYRNLGILSFNLEKDQDAIDYFNKAYSVVKESDIKMGMGYYAHKLAIVYAASGDKEIAKAKFEEALRLLPEDHPEAIDTRRRLEELRKNDLKETEQ